MRVFCDCKQMSYCFLEDAPCQERELFEKFGETQAENADFLKSLGHYSATDLPLDSCPSLKKIKAYEPAWDTTGENMEAEVKEGAGVKRSSK